MIVYYQHKVTYTYCVFLNITFNLWHIFASSPVNMCNSVCINGFLFQYLLTATKILWQLWFHLEKFVCTVCSSLLFCGSLSIFCTCVNVFLFFLHSISISSPTHWLTQEESIWKKVWSIKRSKASFFQARRVYWYPLRLLNSWIQAR